MVIERSPPLWVVLLWTIHLGAGAVLPIGLLEGDSQSYLLENLLGNVVPHFPPLYVWLAHGSVALLGYSDAALRALVLLQQACMAVALTFVLAGIRHTPFRWLALAGAVLACPFWLLAQGIWSEGLFIAFLLVFVVLASRLLLPDRLSWGAGVGMLLAGVAMLGLRHTGVLWLAWLPMLGLLRLAQRGWRAWPRMLGTGVLVIGLVIVSGGLTRLAVWLHGGLPVHSTLGITATWRLHSVGRVHGQAASAFCRDYETAVLDSGLIGQQVVAHILRLHLQQAYQGRFHQFMHDMNDCYLSWLRQHWPQVLAHSGQELWQQARTAYLVAGIQASTASEQRQVAGNLRWKPCTSSQPKCCEHWPCTTYAPIMLQRMGTWQSWVDGFTLSLKSWLLLLGILGLGMLVLGPASHAPLRWMLALALLAILVPWLSGCFTQLQLRYVWPSLAVCWLAVFGVRWFR